MAPSVKRWRGGQGRDGGRDDEGDLWRLWSHLEVRVLGLFVVVVLVLHSTEPADGGRKRTRESERGREREEPDEISNACGDIASRDVGSGACARAAALGGLSDGVGPGGRRTVSSMYPMIVAKVATTAPPPIDALRQNSVSAARRGHGGLGHRAVIRERPRALRRVLARASQEETAGQRGACAPTACA